MPRQSKPYRVMAVNEPSPQAVEEFNDYCTKLWARIIQERRPVRVPEWADEVESPDKEERNYVAGGTTRRTKH